MKTFGKKRLMTVLAAFLLILLTACGTTVKNYTIDSNPKGVLVVAQPKEGHASILVNGDLVMRETNLCETPAKVSARLMSDATEVTLTAEKRGYTASNYELNKNSAETIFFDLKKIDGVLKTDWPDLSLDLNKYLLKLNPNRLQHYSLPPYVTANVKGFKPFIERYGNQPGNEKTYLVYVWNKCITETKGRQIGNLLLTAVGPAVSAVNRSYIYDPAAFLPNTATLVFIHVIDAKTSEVVHIEKRVFPDITNVDALRALADAIVKFPALDEKTK